jgi:hypothetical protein
MYFIEDTVVNTAHTGAGINNFLVILTSKDAKKLYTNCTAAVLRAKSCIMKTATTVQENCEDIYADAKTINETKYNTEEVVLDSVDEDEEA